MQTPPHPYEASHLQLVGVWNVGNVFVKLGTYVSEFSILNKYIMMYIYHVHNVSGGLNGSIFISLIEWVQRWTRAIADDLGVSS